MTIAALSDIHANLPAMEAVLEDFDRRSPDTIICLGDLVGYAPWPNEVVKAIRGRGIPTIAGNYDEGVGLNSDDCGCAYRTDDDKRRGAASISFTNEAVTDETRAYLRTLPRHLRIDFEAPRGSESSPLRLLMVHGSPRRINEYLFEDRPDKSFVRMMQTAEADVMLFGHTHRPYHKTLADNGRGRHAINIGSVGKPKDGDPRACYALIEIDPERPSDGEGLRVEFIRIAYDIERAAAAIEASALPKAFADMLRQAT